MIVTGYQGFIAQRLAVQYGLTYQPVQNEFETAVCAGPRAWVHLGGLSGIPQCAADIEGCLDLNVAGLLRAVRSAETQGIRRFVFASSAAARYLTSLYGASKLLGEFMLRECAVDAFSLRFANVYGEGSWNKTSEVATMCREAVTQGQITVNGDGQETRDFIHVSDVGRAIYTASSDDALTAGVHNVCTGRQASIRYVAYTIADLTGASIVHVRGAASELPRADMEPADFVDAQVRLEDGLRATVAYFQAAARVSE